ncbi:MAG: TrkH family potassium uptake protein [Rhodobacteraceae bacterium]|nr:TrkH family potassium uptake protein [Paracoccaceae bacterium]
MLGRILSLPLLVILMGIGALAMYLPAALAFSGRDYEVALAFFNWGTLFLVLFAIVGIATSTYEVSNQARSHLLALLGAYLILPLMLAVPVYDAVPGARFFNAYLDMVSSFTTTGANFIEGAGRVAQAVHFWRALVGWLGGFFVWVTAIAILAPMNLGGFEVESAAEIGQAAPQITHVADPSERLVRFAVDLLPVYSGLTLVLWVSLVVAGDGPFVAVCHAMSTLATSGISPVGGPAGAPSGGSGEPIILLFFVFAVSRQTFAPDRSHQRVQFLFRNPEFRMAVVAVTVIPGLLFLRHWVGAFSTDMEENAPAAISALWGAVFTVLSFLSTTGFVSGAWDASQAWSGLPTPGVILLGLSLVGGGVATTAGGVKLLRVYALYMHGRRELDKLTHPNSVGGAGVEARRIRRQGAYVAWIFFMLFALSLAAVCLALGLAGLDFEPAMVLAVASLSTTGPLAQVASEVPISYATLNDSAKMIVGAAMVLGRLETLAIIALLNPDFWRS